MRLLKGKKREILSFSRSVWFFPFLITLVFVSLVVLKINGSSVGIYHYALYGNTIEDKDLIYGSPKTVRSDEWLTWTQHTVAQDEANYPTFDTRRGNDSDVTKNAEIPVSNWVNVFRPHNWSFFLLPFEHAFAFKWWSSAYILVLSCYFFLLRILSNKKLLAILLSLSFALSPFVLWWYQSMLLLSLAYGFLIMIVGVRIISQEKLPKVKSPLLTYSIYTLTLTYLGVSFALLLYPPYAIPVILGAATFLFGYLLNLRFDKKVPVGQLLKRLFPFTIAAVVTLVILLAYAGSHRDMITRTSNTIYPGNRQTTSGDLPLSALFDGFLMPVLQDNIRAENYRTNQSEASNFILLLPFLLIPSFIIQVIYFRRYRKIDWALLGVQLLGLLFIVRAVVPVDSILYKALLLNLVPNARLKAGLGFAGLIQLALIIKTIPGLELSKRIKYAGSTIGGVVCFVILLYFGLRVMDQYPDFLDTYALMLGLAFSFSAIVVTFLAGTFRLAASFLLLFTIASSFRIVPLYHGLDFLRGSEVVKSIKKNSGPEDRWITTDDLYFSNLPLAANRKLVSGSQEYPDLELWKQLDEKYENIYNRQARAVFITTNPAMDKMELSQANFFKVKFECSEFVLGNVDYVLGVFPINQPCLKQIDAVSYPRKSFYIYKVL